MAEFEKIKNFRDLGGLTATDGRKVKPGLLLRSGSLIQASDADIKALHDAYDLKAVVDLRTKEEMEMAPDRIVEGVSYIHLPLMDTSGAVWKKIMDPDSPDADPMQALIELAHHPKVQELARNLYVFFVNDTYSQKQFASFLRSLSMLDGGTVLWHCSFGKDRTGMIAAIVLGALGCDRDTIMSDYAKSCKVYEGRLAYVMSLTEDDDEDVKETLRTFIGANVKCFSRGLDEIEDRYGSMSSYLSGTLGISAEEINILKDRYLE